MCGGDVWGRVGDVGVCGGGRCGCVWGGDVGVCGGEM